MEAPVLAEGEEGGEPADEEVQKVEEATTVATGDGDSMLSEGTQAKQLSDHAKHCNV